MSQDSALYDRVLELSLVLPIKPKGQARARHDSRSGRIYTPTAALQYSATIRAAAQAAWGDREPLTGPVVLSIQAAFAIPKTRRGQVEHHLQPPDGDNIWKAVADALQPYKRKGKIIWPGVMTNDAHVVDGRVRKVWSALGSSLSIKLWSLQ